MKHGEGNLYETMARQLVLPLIWFPLRRVPDKCHRFV